MAALAAQKFAEAGSSSKAASPSPGGEAMAAFAGQKFMQAGRPRKDSADSLDTDIMDDIEEIPSMQAVSMLNESSGSDAGNGRKGSSSAAPPVASPAPSMSPPVPGASPPGRGVADGPFPSSISEASSEPMGEASLLVGGPPRGLQATSPPPEKDEIAPITGIGAAFGSPAMQASSQPYFEEVKDVGNLSLASMGSDFHAQGGWAGGSLTSQASARTQKANSPPPSLRTVGPAAGLGTSMISAASAADGTPMNGSAIKPFSPMSVSSADSFAMPKPGAQAAMTKEPVREMHIEDLMEESM